MTSFSFEVSPRKRKRGRFINVVRKEIQKAVSEVLDERGISQSQLAEELGINRSVLSRRLNGRANLTLSSIADLAWVLDRDLHFSMERPDNKGVLSKNYAEPSRLEVDSDDVAEAQSAKTGSDRMQIISVTNG